jgi:hypothetical protein
MGLMSEKAPGSDPTPDGPDNREPEPSVPLPPDFPEGAKVVPTPGLSIEEQRRKLEKESRQDADEKGVPAEGTIHKRRGGSQHNSTHVA